MRRLTWLLLLLTTGCVLRSKGKLDFDVDMKLDKVRHEKQVPAASYQVAGCELRLAAVANLESRTAFGTQFWYGVVDFEVTHPTSTPVSFEVFVNQVEREGASGARYHVTHVMPAPSGWSRPPYPEEGPLTLAPGATARVTYMTQMGHGAEDDPLTAMHHAGVRVELP